MTPSAVAAAPAYDALVADGVAINDVLQVVNPRDYAAGDVCLPEQFAGAADASARLLIQNALFLDRKCASTLTIPTCTYADSEVAHVDVTSTGVGGDVTSLEVSWPDEDSAIADVRTLFDRWLSWRW